MTRFATTDILGVGPYNPDPDGDPMLLQLAASNLHELADGLSGKMIDAALRQVGNDIEDRGTDGKARKVVITLEFNPDEHGTVVHIVPRVQVKVPEYRATVTQSKASKPGRDTVLTFRSDNPDRIDQPTLPFDGGKDGE